MFGDDPLKLVVGRALDVGSRVMREALIESRCGGWTGAMTI